MTIWPHGSTFAAYQRWRYQLDRTVTYLQRVEPLPDGESNGELYLELLNVDLDDPEAILDFTNRAATLGVFTVDPEPAWSFIDVELDVDPFVIERLTAARLALRRGTETGLERGDIETLDEFRAGATLIRDAYRSWRALQEDWDLQQLELESFYRDELALVHPNVTKARSCFDVLVALGTILDHGLKPIHPFAAATIVPVKIVEPDTSFQRVTARERYPRPVPLYAVMCLELLGHIAENATYKTCASETCGRVFVRQAGRAQQGQHRSIGVKYHTNQCAQAQAKRDQRRRNRRTSEQ